MWFPNRSDTNRPVQLQKMTTGSKFRIYKVEELYYACSENKDADQLRGYRVFVFAYADCWFSHEAAQIIAFSLKPMIREYKITRFFCRLLALRFFSDIYVVHYFTGLSTYVN